MNHNPDQYYNRREVSNSDLTALKNILYPHIQYGDKEAAFKFGTLVDALITEQDRVDFFNKTVDDVQYSDEEFEHGIEMRNSLRAEARRDPFLGSVLKLSTTQKFMVKKDEEFSYCDFKFRLDTRCKWDWWMEGVNFGGDLKTTFASSQREFDDAIDFFDWDRSRAWYMDIAGSDRDFIYAISKKNNKIFKTYIERDSEVYRRGKEKYLELAFQYWLLNG